MWNDERHLIASARSLALGAHYRLGKNRFASFIIEPVKLEKSLLPTIALRAATASVRERNDGDELRGNDEAKFVARPRSQPFYRKPGNDIDWSPWETATQTRSLLHPPPNLYLRRVLSASRLPCCSIQIEIKKRCNRTALSLKTRENSYP